MREVPITFRDRRVGQSKMSRRIVVEALVVVVKLRAEELAGRLSWRRRARRDAGRPSGETGVSDALSARGARGARGATAQPSTVPDAQVASEGR
jgi:tRNA G26 N,N-dimethylase Trm1